MMHSLKASSDMNLSSSFHQKKINVPLSKASFRLDKKDDIQLVGQYSRKVALSSQLMTEKSHESFNVKKRQEGANPEVDYIRTLLIDNYDSYTYNIYQELSVVNGVPPVVVRNDEWTWNDAYHYLYKDRAFDNIVISPGPGSPMCSSDIGLCLRVLLECSDIPIFGVCLGHQALAYVHGAEIVHASMPVHGRLSEIQHNGCRLFHNIPSGSRLKVVRYHSLVVDGKSLPKELIPIAWTSSSSLHPFSDMSSLASDDEVNKIYPEINVVHKKDGKSLLLKEGNGLIDERVVMGIMHAHKPHFGVQFHPESVATSYGREMFNNFKDITVDFWLASDSPPMKYQNARSQVPAAGWSRRHLNDRSPARNYGNHKCTASKLNVPKPRISARNLKLRWKKLNGLATTVGGTERIYRELYGTCGAGETFWLDSSSTEKGRAQFSFMGGKGGSLWKQLTYKLSEQSDNHVHSKGGGHLSVQDAQGSVKTSYLAGGFLDYMNKELQSVHCNEKEFEGLPFEFCGGYVGYIGYNLKVECGAAYNHHTSTAPDACFFFADNFLAIDHNSGDVYIVSLRDENVIPSSWLDDTEKKLLSLRGCLTEEENKMKLKLSYPDVLEAGFQSEKSREEYVKDVEQCLGYIRDGESYELCLTTQMRKSAKELDPLCLYLKLREQNPAPYAAWLKFSNQNLSICSSSPERFLRLDRNGILEAKPIKGTISRGSTREKDEQLKLQLQYSEKDQAENLMIVDLLRNDLGRVCEPGSVHVPHLMEVESYATVHTMVSTIRGRKREDVGPFECVRAAFPGGSMTGAPKLRSMEILDSIESCSRGIYSGSIGYFSVNKTFDLNIVIRTVVIHNGEASIGAGGAIIALSKPEDEYDEMILKTRAPVNAIMDLQTQ